MKATICILLVAFVSLAQAADANHSKLAGDLVDLIAGPDTMRAGFLAVMDPMVEAMKQRGVSDAGVKEIRDTMTKWFDQEIKWSEMKPEIIKLYMKEFTESELKELLAFYRTPTGKKTITKLPALVQEGAAIGQRYAKGKEETLTKMLNPVLEKHGVK